MIFKPGKVIKEFQKGGKKVVFRYLKPSDAGQAREFINSMIRERAKIQWQKPFTIEKERKWLRDRLRKNREGNSLHIVAEIGGRFAGDAAVVKEPGEATKHVGSIGIGLAKEYRGLGIGKELLKTICQQARDILKCRIAVLVVYENNEEAIRVYERVGFRKFGMLPKGANHYGKDCDVIYMHKELGK